MLRVYFHCILSNLGTYIAGAGAMKEEMVRLHAVLVNEQKNRIKPSLFAIT